MPPVRLTVSSLTHKVSKTKNQMVFTALINCNLRFESCPSHGFEAVRLGSGDNQIGICLISMVVVLVRLPFMKYVLAERSESSEFG